MYGMMKEWKTKKENWNDLVSRIGKGKQTAWTTFSLLNGTGAFN
jgi:hypothetical protein